MTLTSGQIGNAVVGSDHVGRVCKYAQLKVNVINQDLIDGVLNGETMFPMVRVYSEDAGTGVQTEITGATFVSIQNNKRSRKATWNAVIKPEKVTTAYTDLFEDELPANNLKWFVVRAGYIIDGAEVLVPILKGVIKDRRPAYGRNSASISLNGFDFSDRLDRVPGVYSGFSSAIVLMKAVLNDAGINTFDFAEFTDFDITGIEFNQNTGLEVIERLSAFKGEFSWYFTGAGIFVARDLPDGTTAKYDYPTTILGTFNPSSTSRDKITEVIVTGTGVSITRQTDATDQAKWGGINRENLQNSIITTQTEAEDAADNIIDESRKDQGAMGAVFNPFLYIDDILSTNQQEVGSVKYRIEGFTHTLQASQGSISVRSRVDAERTDFTSPTKVTV